MVPTTDDNLTPASAPVASIAFEAFQVKSIRLKQEAVSNGEKPSYNVEFSPSALISWGQGRFVLQLSITVSSNPVQHLNVELDTKSHFTFDSQLSVKDLNNLFKHNTLGITFPYVRAYLSALTALSGLMTVTMPTFNLTSLSEVLARNITEVDSI